jgi:hypothetical protein
MPEFILDTGDSDATARFNALDSFTQGYIEALFFTDEEQLCNDPDSDFEMPDVAVNLKTMESRFVGGNSPGFGDLAEPALARIVVDCQRFQADNAALLGAACELEPGSEGLRYAREALDDRRLGQLFWYARNGHGVSFTDDGHAPCLEALQNAARPFRQVDPYIGDDGRVYLM